MWFEDLTGFIEESPNLVRANLEVNGNTITSRVNGKSMICGQLETPSLAELRSAALEIQGPSGQTQIREVIGDVKSLHKEADSAGGLFQVASQFNLLEMPSHYVTPERGVGVYENDLTQGPACAMAAGAGTIYRTYFAKVNGQTGQSSDNQIDCLSDLGQILGNTNERLWEMKNGYAIASQSEPFDNSDKIKALSCAGRDTLRQALRIGIQGDTQVTLGNCKHLVTQAYCSALPVGYSKHEGSFWSEFAQLILEASYESTLCAAVLNFAKTGNNKVYLTLLGGGAFRNDRNWIIAAIRRAVEMFPRTGLDIAIVSHGRANPDVRDLISSLTHTGV